MATSSTELDGFGHSPGCTHYGKKAADTHSNRSHSDLFCTCHRWKEPRVLPNGTDIAWPALWTQAQADVWRVEHGLERPAATVSPAGAWEYVGKHVTVEGVASVHQIAGGMCLIDLKGHGPDAPFAAVILNDNAGQFPDVQSYDGKTLDISGMVELYQGMPEIVLKSPSQIIAR
jgi:hypothetical protein